MCNDGDQVKVQSDNGQHMYEGQTGVIVSHDDNSMLCFVSFDGGSPNELIPIGRGDLRRVDSVAAPPPWTAATENNVTTSTLGSLAGVSYDPRFPTVPGYEPYDPRFPTAPGYEPYDPRFPTAPDQEMCDGPDSVQQEPPRVNWDDHWQELWTQEGLNLNSNRIQIMKSKKFLWHSSRPYDCLDPRTLEFIQWNDDERLEIYYRNADRFCQKSPRWKEIWLLGEPRYCNAMNWKVSLPSSGVACIYVPWAHIAQHIYEYCGLTVKENHSFWPYGTTEDEVLGFLVEALNNKGSVKFDGAAAEVTYDGPTVVKTFYLPRQQGHEDHYTGAEMSDICDVLRCDLDLCSPAALGPRSRTGSPKSKIDDSETCDPA